MEGFWLRGRLNEPLPIDPNLVLPLVSRVRISALVERELTATLQSVNPTYEIGAGTPDFALELHDTNGQVLEGAEVQFFMDTGSPRLELDDGVYTTDFSSHRIDSGSKVAISIHGRELQIPYRYRPPGRRFKSLLKVRLQIGGLQPELAMTAGQCGDRPITPPARRRTGRDRLAVRARCVPLRDPAGDRRNSRRRLCPAPGAPRRRRPALVRERLRPGDKPGSGGRPRNPSPASRIMNQRHLHNDAVYLTTPAGCHWLCQCTSSTIPVPPRMPFVS